MSLADDRHTANVASRVLGAGCYCHPISQMGAWRHRSISDFLGVTQLVNLFPGPKAPSVRAPALSEVLGMAELGESQNLYTDVSWDTAGVFTSPPRGSCSWAPGICAPCRAP